MINWNQTNDFWAYWLRRFPADVGSMLDVCSGKGEAGAIMKCCRPEVECHAIEIFEPLVERSRAFYKEIYQGDAIKRLSETTDDSYDVVVCFESIEHFDKYRALYLIGEMERVASRMVFLSSVNWFFKQPFYDGNPYQAHKCLVTSREIKRLGYTVRGLGNRPLNWGALFRVPLVHFSEGWFAWKNIKKENGNVSWSNLFRRPKSIPVTGEVKS